jgi:hypothetical protein
MRALARPVPTHGAALRTSVVAAIDLGGRLRAEAKDPIVPTIAIFSSQITPDRRSL